MDNNENDVDDDNYDEDYLVPVCMCHECFWCGTSRPCPHSEVFNVSLSAVEATASPLSPPSLASSSCFISMSRLATHPLVNECSESIKFV